jgi:hypothetical protein
MNVGPQLSTSNLCTHSIDERMGTAQFLPERRGEERRSEVK